jgi:hypothetical protein
VGVSLLLKSKPVAVASNTWKAGSFSVLEVQPFIAKNRHNKKRRET